MNALRYIVHFKIAIFIVRKAVFLWAVLVLSDVPEFGNNTVPKHLLFAWEQAQKEKPKNLVWSSWA